MLCNIAFAVNIGYGLSIVLDCFYNLALTILIITGCDKFCPAVGQTAIIKVKNNLSLNRVYRSCIFESTEHKWGNVTAICFFGSDDRQL